MRQLFEGTTPEQTTDKTPTSVAAIIDQARADRAAGFAWSQGNFESGIGSCAAVILDHTGQPVGGLNVSGPENRFKGDNAQETRNLRECVVRAARHASAELGHIAR